MHEAWSDILVSAFREVVQRLALVTPRLLALLTLLAAGWIVAALARRLTVRILRVVDFDPRCARWGLTGSLARGGLRQAPSQLLGRLIFWTLFLVAVLMGIEALEMPATSGLVAGVVRFLPNIVIALLVLAVGWLLANFAAQAVLIAAVNAQVPLAPLMAGAFRWLVLIFAVAAALTQLGIAREMVLLTFGIAFAGAVLALAIAVGLGAKDLAREMLEAHLRGQDRDRDSTTHV
jgi:small-conductance mechanosensitive channel